jgi:hypothetical protein
MVVLLLLQSPLAVSWQWILTQIITVSLNYTLQTSHIKSSLHSGTLATNSFLHSLPYRTELSTDNCLGCPSCLQDNSSAQIMQKTQPLYCCRGMFTGLLPSQLSQHGPHRKHHSSFVAWCLLQALPSNCCYLHSHCLAVGLHATIKAVRKMYSLMKLSN